MADHGELDTAMTRVRSAGGAAVLVLVISVVLLIPGVARVPFDDPGEGMHAEIAREILRTGDWVTLHLNGVRYFDKPPLLYWLTALSMRAWTPTEGAARLWPLVGSLTAVAGTVFLGARLLGPRGGAVAGLALLSSPGFFAYGHYFRPETLFVAAIQWGFTWLLLASVESPRFFLFGCLAFGLAALIKDPLGAFGPVVVILLVQARAGRLPRLPRWIFATGLILLLSGMAWYAVVERRNPGFVWYTVVDNHILNAVRARQFPDEDVPLSGGEFLATAGLGVFPWVIPAVLGVGAMARRRAWRRPDEAPWLALATWAVGVFAVFSAAPFKLPHYGLPAYPALALLAARWWTEGRGTRPLLVVHTIVFAAIALGCGWVYFGNGEGFMEWVFGATDVYTRKEAAIGQASPFPSWGDLRPLIGGTTLVFGGGSVALAVALARRRLDLGLPLVLVTLLAWMPFVGSAVSAVAASRSVRDMARELQRRAGPDDLVVHEGPIENSGALEFYGGRRPAILDGTVSVLGFGSTFPDAKETFWDRAELRRAWGGPRRVFLITTRSPDQSAVRELGPLRIHRIAVGGGRWLYSNRP